MGRRTPLFLRFALATLVTLSSPAGEPRVWTTLKGATVTASVERVEGDRVVLALPGGRTVAVAADSLSLADRQHLDSSGLLKLPELRSWTSASGQKLEARLVERTPDLLTLEDAAGKRIGIKPSALSFADRQYAVHRHPLPAAQLLAGEWRGYAVDQNGQTYQHRFTFRMTGAKGTAEAVMSTDMSEAQVARAREKKAPDPAPIPGAHALTQSFDVTLTHDTVTLQGTQLDLFYDQRDEKGTYTTDRFIATLQSPGLLIGTWGEPSTNCGYFFASAPGALAVPPPLDLATGKIHRLVCAGATNLHYTLYIPCRYDPQKPTPLLINDSPSANAKPLSTSMAEETGWIMAGLTESANNADTWRTCQANCAGALFDIQRRLNIDPKRVYFSGFSGGSRRAAHRAINYPDQTAGLICIGAGYSYWNSGPREGHYRNPPPGIPIFFIVGQTDMNFDEVTKRVYPEEEKRGRPIQMVIHPAGHTWGRPEDHEAAIRWLHARAATATNAPPRAAGSR
jgi:predicted esterase